MLAVSCRPRRVERLGRSRHDHVRVAVSLPAGVHASRSVCLQYAGGSCDTHTERPPGLEHPHVLSEMLRSICYCLFAMSFSLFGIFEGIPVCVKAQIYKRNLISATPPPSDSHGRITNKFIKNDIQSRFDAHERG